MASSMFHRRNAVAIPFLNRAKFSAFGNRCPNLNLLPADRLERKLPNE
jgi:hypothetical protein